MLFFSASVWKIRNFIYFIVFKLFWAFKGLIISKNIDRKSKFRDTDANFNNKTNINNQINVNRNETNPRFVAITVLEYTINKVCKDN